MKREREELQKKKEKYEKENPNKKFFVPQRTEYKSLLHQKLLEINYIEDRIDDVYYLRNGGIGNE